MLVACTGAFAMPTNFSPLSEAPPAPMTNLATITYRTEYGLIQQAQPLTAANTSSVTTATGTHILLNFSEYNYRSAFQHSRGIFNITLAAGFHFHNVQEEHGGGEVDIPHHANCPCQDRKYQYFCPPDCSYLLAQINWNGLGPLPPDCPIHCHPLCNFSTVPPTRLLSSWVRAQHAPDIQTLRVPQTIAHPDTADFQNVRSYTNSAIAGIAGGTPTNANENGFAFTFANMGVMNFMIHTRRTNAPTDAAVIAMLNQHYLDYYFPIIRFVAVIGQPAPTFRAEFESFSHWLGWRQVGSLNNINIVSEMFNTQKIGLTFVQTGGPRFFDRGQSQFYDLNPRFDANFGQYGVGGGGTMSPTFTDFIQFEKYSPTRLLMSRIQGNPIVVDTFENISVRIYFDTFENMMPNGRLEAAYRPGLVDGIPAALGNSHYTISGANGLNITFHTTPTPPGFPWVTLLTGVGVVAALGAALYALNRLQVAAQVRASARRRREKQNQKKEENK